MPAWRASSGDDACSRRPFSQISPSSGWTEPESTLTSVLLPAPFSPISACVSPPRQLRLAPLSAFTPPKDFCSPVISSELTVIQCLPTPPSLLVTGSGGRRRDLESDRGPAGYTALTSAGLRTSSLLRRDLLCVRWQRVGQRQAS